MPMEKPLNSAIIFLLHQVWRGAFLLADFILSEPLMFKGATVLEMGAGTGLASIIMATIAKTVYCTGTLPSSRYPNQNLY